MNKLHRLKRTITFGTTALAIAAIGSLSLSSVGATQAQAATATATIAVSASIAGSCTVGGGALSFGTYASASPSTASTAVEVTCTNGTNAMVSLNQGNNNNRVPAAGTRALNNGANLLGYDIYTDNTYATVWNNASAQPVVSTGSPVTLTAYGRVPSGQNPATGSYNDTITITVTF